MIKLRLPDGTAELLPVVAGSAGAVAFAWRLFSGVHFLRADTWHMLPALVLGAAVATAVGLLTVMVMCTMCTIGWFSLNHRIEQDRPDKTGRGS